MIQQNYPHPWQENHNIIMYRLHGTYNLSFLPIQWTTCKPIIQDINPTAMVPASPPRSTLDHYHLCVAHHSSPSPSHWPLPIIITTNNNSTTIIITPLISITPLSRSSSSPLSSLQPPPPPQPSSPYHYNHHRDIITIIVFPTAYHHYHSHLTGTLIFLENGERWRTL